MECVYICVEKQNEYGNFWNFIEYIRPLILNLGPDSVFRDVNEVSAFLWLVINILWEQQMPQLLTEFLTRREFEILVNHENVKSKLNSLLMKSCRHESDYDSPMVKVLIMHEERLNLCTKTTK